MTEAVRDEHWFQ